MFSNEQDNTPAKYRFANEYIIHELWTEFSAKNLDENKLSHNMVFMIEFDFDANAISSSFLKARMIEVLRTFGWFVNFLTILFLVPDSGKKCVRVSGTFTRKKNA